MQLCSLLEAVVVGLLHSLSIFHVCHIFCGKELPRRGGSRTGTSRWRRLKGPGMLRTRSKLRMTSQKKYLQSPRRPKSLCIWKALWIFHHDSDGRVVSSDTNVFSTCRIIHQWPKRGLERTDRGCLEPAEPSATKTRQPETQATQEDTPSKPSLCPPAAGRPQYGHGRAASG